MVFLPETWRMNCEKCFSLLQIIHLLTLWVVWSPDLKRCPSLEVPPDSKSCLAVKSGDDWLLYLTSLSYFFEDAFWLLKWFERNASFCPGFSSKSQWCSSWERNSSASVETTAGFLFAISHLHFIISKIFNQHILKWWKNSAQSDFTLCYFAVSRTWMGVFGSGRDREITNLIKSRFWLVSQIGSTNKKLLDRIEGSSMSINSRREMTDADGE